MVCVAGAAGLCRAAFGVSSVSSVLAAPVAALALALPADRRRAQVLWQVCAVGAGHRAAAESDERLVRERDEFGKFLTHACSYRL